MEAACIGRATCDEVRVIAAAIGLPVNSHFAPLPF